mgnify:CR=1 FL=1
MKSTFIRSPKDNKNPYVMIRKEPLENESLSWKSKGILAYLLSLPDDWQIYESELVKHSTDGRDSLRSGIKELIELGYIERVRKQGSDGKFAGYNYTVYENPTRVGKTNNGKTENGKSNTTNNNLTNNNITNINNITLLNTQPTTIEKPAPTENQDIEAMFNEMWELYPLKRGKTGISITKKKEIFNVGADEFKRCIDRYKKEVEKDRKEFKELRYVNGSTFFNSRYKDYLDKNYAEKEVKPFKLTYKYSDI